LAVALATAAIAQATEVTKWNNIAVNTVLAQPPITSAPPAAAVFVAMVQGAVYGAVNAIDRHQRPYLVTRRFPMASMDAAAATAAFRVLDALFPAQDALLQAEYDASLAAIPTGSLKDTGVQVGQAAADAMLAEGHAAARCCRARSRPERVCGSPWQGRQEHRCAIRARGWRTA